ncbi:substrate-binding domain-containing protein [Bradyrhizobium sp. Leo170]|uniref:substrate-binding domain-containing protein n=1 Tax=Bradyrhizobium sp. Leo170 TaxID=1571199 RepID=UPI0013EE8E89|nr:substrate-binding domain-containing protein [Bradyrhizobium sp. Leo170]
MTGKYFMLRNVGLADLIAVSIAGAGTAHAADKIGVSMPNVKGPWFTPVLYGISDEAKKRGYDVVIQDAGGYANVDKQVSQFSNLAVQKVRAILVDPANPASFNGVVREAKAGKIFVIGAGSPIVASDVEPDAAASSSHCSIGHELAKGAKTLLPNGGTIAVLAGPAGAFWASDRLRCFKEDLAGGNIKLVAEQTSEQDPAIALSLANDFLQRFPTVDVLYGADDTYGVGAARAVQGVQKCGKVKVLFAVLGEAAEEMMRAGCADYVVAQQPVKIGRSAVDMMDALVKGKPLEKKKDEVPLIPVTSANLNSIDKTGMQAPKGWTP